MRGETVVIAGGSVGLGRELAELMVARGADVIILARNPQRLTAAKEALWPRRVRDDQLIQTESVDLTDPAQVATFVKSLKTVPSHVYCNAGGSDTEIGLFAELTPDQISSCLSKNYLTAAYLAHAVIRLWIERPEQGTTRGQTRHLVFTNSTAALVAIPGYIAYTPSKTAVRALADTLRQEVLAYRPLVDIHVHSAFPGTIFTESFAREQQIKPAITKRIEGSDNPTDGLTPKAVAEAMVAGVDRDEYSITMDFQTRMLLNNMRGPGPANTFVWDWLIGFLASLIWPVVRRMHDRLVTKYGREMFEKVKR